LYEYANYRSVALGVQRFARMGQSPRLAKADRRVRAFVVRVPSSMQDRHAPFREHVQSVGPPRADVVVLRTRIDVAVLADNIVDVIV